MNSAARSLVRQGKSLGPLEQQVLTAVRRHKSATVRELIEAGDIKHAYTTIMTTMDRLYRKELLNRVPEGRAFRYLPRYSRQELKRVTAVRTVRELLSRDPAAMLSYLVEAVSKHDARLLDELEHAVSERKRILGKRKKSDVRTRLPN